MKPGDVYRKNTHYICWLYKTITDNGALMSLKKDDEFMVLDFATVKQNSLTELISVQVIGINREFFGWVLTSIVDKDGDTRKTTQHWEKTA